MTKHLRFILSFLSVVLVIFTVAGLSRLPCAHAEEAAEADDWDSIIEQFLADHKVSPEQVAIGFYNTVTGEEHYIRPDEYMETGSTYKVPLNMVYAERIYKGEMDFDTQVGGARYGYLQYVTIVNSNNEYASVLWQNIGPYGVFRDAIAGYMGVDPATVEAKYYRNRFFTARQVVNCLKALYAEPERFPGIIDCMLLAEQDNYFCYHPQNYPIAHKYGYISEGGSLYICDSGICYTDDPIIIVIFTESVKHPVSFISDYCTLMCDYAERTRAERLAIEEPANGGSADTAENARTEPDPVPAAAVGPEASDPETRDPETVKENNPVMPIIILCAAVMAATAAVIAGTFRKKIRPVSGLLSVLLAAAALALCVTGITRGTLYTRIEGDPCNTVTGFFESIMSGDQATACAFLADYSDIGLDKEPEDTVSAEMIRALRESYAYELVGDCVTYGLSATQKVRFQYLDFSKMSADLRSSTNECVRLMVERLSKNEIYDGSGQYREEFISSAYAEATDMVLSHAEDYYSQALIDVTLVYRDGRWQMNSNPELFAALCGGN